jgi:hypothetical protein
MLPMRYAPLRGGDVPTANFPVHDLPAPPRQSQEGWQRVLGAALAFWREASRDKRISQQFRGTCAENAELLERWSDTWAN